MPALGRLDHRKLDRAAVEIADDDARPLAPRRGGPCKSFGNVQSVHLGWLAADKTTVAPHVPHAVYLVDDVYSRVSMGAGPLGRVALQIDPRKRGRIVFFCRSRHRRLQERRWHQFPAPRPHRRGFFTRR